MFAKTEIETVEGGEIDVIRERKEQDSEERMGRREGGSIELLLSLAKIQPSASKLSNWRMNSCSV